jgi:hypothetical protein
MQSYEYIRYQPGRSQAAFLTFNMSGSVANVVKFAGLCDGTNGIEFEVSGSTNQFVIYSGTSNGNEVAQQSSWNLDQLNGTGPSGLTLDVTKVQILVIDFQALYVGRVRVGFDINGIVYYVHQFNHANSVSFPYLQTATLPIRCGMTCGATATTKMSFICSSVISEGGQEENGGLSFSATGSVSAGNGTDTLALSVQPKTTFNGNINRIKFIPDSVDILVTGGNPVFWKLVVGQALTGTSYSDINTLYSAYQASSVGTLSGSHAAVILSGWGPTSDHAAAEASEGIINKYPLALDYTGSIRTNGSMQIIVQGIGGTSQCYAALNWRELR